MNKDEHKFFSIGCTNCGSFRIGGDDEGQRFIPIFHNPTLAQMAMAGWLSDAEAAAHPPKVIEIGVRIL